MDAAMAQLADAVLAQLPQEVIQQIADRTGLPPDLAQWPPEVKAQIVQMLGNSDAGSQG